MISDQDKSMFKESKSQEVAMLPRSRAMRFTLVPSRTQAFAKSPIPQMMALANRMADTEVGGLTHINVTLTFQN